MNTKPKAIKVPAKPRRTRKDAALERLEVAGFEAREAMSVGIDLLNSIQPGTLGMTNALRLLIYTNSAIMAFERAEEHIKEID